MFLLRRRRAPVLVVNWARLLLGMCGGIVFWFLAFLHLSCAGFLQPFTVTSRLSCLPGGGHGTEWWALPVFCLQNNRPWQPNRDQTWNRSRSRRPSPRRVTRGHSWGRSQEPSRALKSSPGHWSSWRRRQRTARPWGRRWAWTTPDLRAFPPRPPEPMKECLLSFSRLCSDLGLLALEGTTRGHLLGPFWSWADGKLGYFKAFSEWHSTALLGDAFLWWKHLNSHWNLDCRSVVFVWVYREARHCSGSSNYASGCLFKPWVQSSCDFSLGPLWP